MSRHSGAYCHTRREVRAQKKAEALERNALTPPERTRNARRLAALASRAGAR